jgi:hypothetical protein
MEQGRRYEPRHGVDYLINFYALAGIALEAEGDVALTPPDELDRAVIGQLRLYDPSRLEGMAGELLKAGLERSKWLHVAREIFADPDRRAEYDEILRSWDGPVSTDGRPVMDVTRFAQMQSMYAEPDEIEASMVTFAGHAVALSGYNPGLLEYLEEQLKQAGDNPSAALRAQYDAALLNQDLGLALEELQRSKLLGLPGIDKQNFWATTEYGDEIETRLEAAKTEQLAYLRLQALGGVSTRLALLAGEERTPPTEGVVELAAAAEPTLPAYFEGQAARVQAIADEREEIAKKRLSNMQPTYPAAELQTEFRAKLAFGGSGKKWLMAELDPEAFHGDIGELPEDIAALLQAGDFGTVIERGFNILTFEPLEHIDPYEQALVAIAKYLNKYGYRRPPAE